MIDESSGLPQAKITLVEKMLLALIALILVVVTWSLTSTDKKETAPIQQSVESQIPPKSPQ